MSTATTNASYDPQAPWTRASAIRVRAKAWSAHPVGLVLAHVGPDRRVWVWDDVACRWTTCHALSARAEARIRRMAGMA